MKVDVDSFFQELLNGAYDSKTEVDTDDSTTGESAQRSVNPWFNIKF